ncbi:MAG TPA: helix-turn-helix domain-containing protein [Candidatus Gastranaerophilaceae bacterium]|nr:helix-turn-helix domain-containing protein [Candidatus Gastranaerophilaceae bacterium]HPT41759.1 helix-turn-helix domain-containing protein [Candidatus Gastranaerophilaceae bacterium]
MPEYLSKEEIKRWRSSLEKITLEEYAARLGKVIAEEKHTNDIVDIVLKGQPVMSRFDNLAQTRGEKITSIAQRAFEREKELSKSSSKTDSIIKKTIAKQANAQKQEQSEAPKNLKEEVRLVFNKALTDREQAVFDYFAQNNNKIVYAKDLAKLLDLPRDYVYKYIKNLRTKIDGDCLKNADNGGFVLSV